ncbi:3-dehydroquinate synthase [Spirochaetota bacterium]
MNKIKVKIKNISYNIFIGKEIFQSLREKLNGHSYDRVAVVVSSRVYELHRKYIDESIGGLDYGLYVMEDSEENKNYSFAEQFFEQFLKNGLTRKSAVIAIGGGVVGDFAGYLAAIYMRGIPVIHVPTTLLAMVDSSIGGKVAVNCSVGKNILGAFHQPGMVISDITFLETLPHKEFKNGMSEILKHGLLGEKKTLGILEDNDNYESIKQNKILLELIYQSALFKSTVVEKDEKEKGLRAILNLGHTIGHAIESFQKFKNISHGEAVSMGIIAEMDISRKLGWISSEEYERVGGIIKKLDLIDSEIDASPTEIIDHMKYDKKKSDDTVKFALLKSIFKPVFNQVVDDNILEEVLSGIFGNNKL